MNHNITRLIFPRGATAQEMADAIEEVRRNKLKERSMTFADALEKIIDQGIHAAERDYARDDQKLKREGSIAGFNACRGKDAVGLKELLDASAHATRDARSNNQADYWWFRCYEAEVEWVCNVASCILVNEGLAPIVTPTARGMLQAAKIIGIRS